MRKRLMVVSVIIMLMAGFGLQLAYADENPERHPISMPAHLAPVYGFAGIERDVDHEAADKAAPMQMPLGYIPTSSPGSQIATTTYDYQHNCSMGRMIEHRGSQYISMVWMYKETSVLGGDRDVILQTYDMDEYFCDLKVDIPVNTGRAGYCALDVDPASGYAIPTAHEGLAIYAAASYFNGGFPHTYGGPFNAHYPTDNFGWWLNPGTGPFNENLWPKIEWQVGSQTFLHLVACEAGTPPEDGQTISYYRKQFDDYNDDGGNVWSDQHLIDTVKSLNVTLAASQISNRVAIVWAGPCEYKKDTPNEFNSQYTNDVYYVVSDNQGFEWANIGTPANPSLANMLDNTAIDGGRITTYAEDGEYKAYCDLSALFDSDDYLHVVWNCRHWSDNGTTLDDRNGAIFHWGEDDQVISPVVIADWDDGLAETNVWAADVCKMTISECDDKLYILYTQFGNKSNPSGDISIEGNVNSELYLTASNDDGLSWDKPQNLTNSETPGCAPGDCDSDNWASMARYGRPANDCGGGNFPTEGNVLDIMYINDKMPGGVIQPQSMYWTVNPVMWLTTPCRDVGEICDPNDQWPTYAHDFGRTSKSGLEFGDLTGLTRQWVYESSNSGELSAFSSPVIANDIVYVAYNQSLHAIDLLTGAPLWDTYTHGDYTQVIFNKLRSAPTIDVANNRIYFGTGATQGFVCADATTGDIIWARGVMVDPLPGTPGDTRWAHSVIIGDAIYFGDENGQLYALDKNAGYEIHYEPLGLPIYTAPSYGVVDVLGTPTDMLFFGGAQGIPGPGGIFGMEPVGGIFIPHWFYENPDNATLSDGFPSTPVFYQGDLLAHSYVGNPANNNGYNGYRINIDPSDGSEIWSDYEMGRPLYSSPAVFDGIAYFGSDAYTDISSVHPDVLGLKAVDIATNAILWQETSANPADMTPMPPSVTCDPYVFSGMRNGKWRIHDAVTGDLQLQYHLDDDIVMCTALAYGSDGREYAVVNTYGGNSTGTGRVYAFAVEDVVRPRMHITDFERTIKTIEPSEIDPVLCTCSVAISNLGDATLYYTATLVAGDPPREAATSSEVNDEMIPIQATVKSDSKEAASDRGSSWASWVSPYPMGDVVNGQIYTGGLPVSFIFEVDPTALSPGDNYFYIDVESTDPDFAPWEDPQPTPQARMKMIVDMPAYGCGDANSDGSLNVGDAVFLINMVFKSGPEPVPYDLGEVNCDGTINVGDAVWMINYVFKSGPAPCDCVAP